MKHFILSEPSFPEYEAERHVVCQLLASLTRSLRPRTNMLSDTDWML